MVQSTGTGKETLERLASGLAGMISDALSGLAGSETHFLNRELIGGITGAALLTSAAIILLVLFVNLILISWIRRMASREEPGSGAASWRRFTLEAANRPLGVLIWIYGAYFALAPLLLKPGPTERMAMVRSGVNGLFDVGVFAVILWLFLRFTSRLETRLQTSAAKTKRSWDDVWVPVLIRSLRIVVPVMAVIFAAPLLGLPEGVKEIVSKGSSLLVIGALAWMLVQGVMLGEKLILAKFDLKEKDNLRARQVHTQVQVLRKAVIVVIAILTVGMVLMSFEEVRRLGTSILASAGVLGIIFGFAAQKTIANLFAGFQLAMTQPIRIDDVVIVENEWGRIEEITLTYVVIAIWDRRRLIVPLSYFIERPFQNWTRISADIVGVVTLQADYTLPFDKVRDELKRIIEGSEHWNRETWNMQVTDASDRTVTIRVLMTASDASVAWTLRCEVREKLIGFVQREYPQCLPRFRGSLDGLETGSRESVAGP